MLQARQFFFASLVAVSCLAGKSGGGGGGGPPGCGLADDTTPPHIVARVPTPEEEIFTNSHIFLVDVHDGQNDDGTCVRKVEIEFNQVEPKIFGKSGFLHAAREPNSQATWALSHTFPGEGLWEWRIKANDFSTNAMTSNWTRFHVRLDDITPSPVLSPDTQAPVPTQAPTTPAPTALDPARILQDAKADIVTLINANPGLPAKLLRLAFHDCVGGCDGCVDLANGDNNGLALPIQLLDPVVDAHANADLGISRADIWALAELTAAELAQPVQTRIAFPMTWIGRADCAGGPEQRTAGPDHALPSPDQTTTNVLHWFSEEFGFDPRQTTALFGAHSIGTLSRENSGFNGPNGWDNNNERLDNNYYALMVGGTSVNDSLDVLINDAPGWTLNPVNNSDLPTPDRFQWERTQGNGDVIVALNTDIALVRDMEGFLDESTGEVTGCRFRNQNVCPHAAATLGFAAEYKFDNALFLNDFRDVFSAMLVHGYDATGPCNADEGPCVLGSVARRNL